MASNSSTIDQTVVEHTEEKKASGDTKFEGEEINFQPKDIVGKDEVEEGLTVTASTANVTELKLEPEDISSVDAKLEQEDVSAAEKVKEEGHAKGRENDNSVLESEPSVSSGQTSEQKGETQSQADGAHKTKTQIEVQEKSSDAIETNTPKEEQVDFGETASTSIEVPVKDLEVESGSPEEQKRVVITDVVVPDVSELPEKCEDNLKAPATVEVSVEVVEAEAGSPEEEKQENIIGTHEKSSNVTLADGGAGISESSFDDEKASIDALAVAKSEENLKVETTETPLEIEEVHAETEATHTPSDEAKAYEGRLEKKSEDFQGGMEVSTNLDASQVAELTPEIEKAPEPGEKVVEKKEEAIESYGSSSSHKDAELGLEEGTTLEAEKLVGKEKDESTENLQTDLAETFTELKGGVSSEQVKIHETLEGERNVLQVTSKDHNFAPGASEATLAGGQGFPGDDTEGENLKEQDATFVVAPKTFTIVDELSAQVIKEKNENSKGETEGQSGTSKGLSLAQAFAEEVQHVQATETVEEKDHEASKELVFEEKTTIHEVKGIEASELSKNEKEKLSIVEVKDIEALGTVKLEDEALGDKQEENNKSKDQDPVLSSDTRDAKLVKEFSKREPSSIFTKMKRSLVKAKKAILGKSPAAKTASE
ncbi:hypothetical protein HPP92_010588 [Vanilla planifolia]|uniref:Uncharacterized protein n=1 Tax=Vanilla planifolia TaxID=51239 RepID=A0A835R162_VANPL|nr:hypothetical protein HPP92_010588 [Vanilla planifolia]